MHFPLRLILVDDHSILNDGLAAYLNSTSDLDVQATFNIASRVLDYLNLPGKEIDIIITDLQMEGMDGVSLTKVVKEHFPEIKVIALSMSDDAATIQKALEAGVSGYLLKSSKIDEIKKAILTIASGQDYFSPIVSRKVMEWMRGGGNKPNKAQKILTPRESEVLYLILKQYSNQEIADQLHISLRTVDTHKRNLIEKTGSKNIAGLVMYAINNQLFDDI